MVAPRRITARKANRLLRREAWRNPKAKYIRCIEAKRLRCRGKRDGEAGFPQLQPDESWLSPFMSEEWDTYDEYSEKQWKRCESRTAIRYREIRIIADGIRHDIAEFYRLSGLLLVFPDPANLTVRFLGEEEIKPDEIQMRREYEWRDKQNIYRTQMESILEGLKGKRVQLQEIVGLTTGVENITRHRCEKVKAHTQARLDVYWSGVQKTHKDKANLPAVPPEVDDDTSKGEVTYFEEGQHQDSLEMIEDLLEKVDAFVASCQSVLPPASDEET